MSVLKFEHYVVTGNDSPAIMKVYILPDEKKIEVVVHLGKFSMSESFLYVAEPAINLREVGIHRIPMPVSQKLDPSDARRVFDLGNNLLS